MRIAWLVYGDLEQPTGGYVYDRLVVEGLRALGDEVELADPVDVMATTAACERADILVGDALCVRELGPLFEGVTGAGDRRAQSHRDAAPRVLLVHHFPSWEIERSDRERMHGYEARALAASDHIVATSAATRERLAGECGGLPIDIVAPGADRLPRVARTPRVARPRTSRSGAGDGGAPRVELLFVGSLVQRKRVTLLLDALDALENLPGPHPALTLLGDADREPEHARAIADRIDASDVLRPSVTMAGVVGDDALAQWFARADALVLPSSLEGYGMVLTEALHAGLPVLVARPAATAAAIAGLGAVRVFDDARDLAELLARFVGDPAMREAMCVAAAATPLPTWADAVAAFRRALASARRRGP